MSQSLPSAQPCSPCGSPAPITTTPGPQGPAGADGTNGTDGIDAFTAVATYNPSPQPVMPAEGANVIIDTTTSTAWMVPGENVFVQFMGTFQVVTINGVTTVTLKNLKNTASGAYAGNVAPGTSFPALATIGASGLQGPNGILTGAAGGDLTGTYPNPTIAVGAVSTAKMAATGVGAITRGDATHVAQVTTDVSGRITAMSNVAITYPSTGALLTAIAALSPTVADKIIHTTGVDTVDLKTITAFALTLLAGVDAPTVRGLLGVIGLDMLLYQHQKTAGGGPDTFVSDGTFKTVPLNTEVIDTGNHGSISGNQITLAAGTYRARFSVIATTTHPTAPIVGLLYNTSGLGSVLFYGTDGYADTGGQVVQLQSEGVGRFTLAGSGVLELRARLDGGNGTFGQDGFGVSVGVNNIWSWIEFLKE